MAFKDLYEINVNEYVEKKKSGNSELTYLSWAHAWAATKKIYEDASYTIWKNENGLPYVYDPLTGYMVYTSVTIEGITHEMWLPVMDGANKAMKAEAYTYETKYGQKKVEAASMFDINKAIMRCLVKNLGMFGLGLYIYAGEDIPEGDEDMKLPMLQEEPQKKAPKKKEAAPKVEAEIVEEKAKDTFKAAYPSRDVMLKVLYKHYPEESNPLKNLLAFWKISSVDEASDEMLAVVYDRFGGK